MTCGELPGPVTVVAGAPPTAVRVQADGAVVAPVSPGSTFLTRVRLRLDGGVGDGAGDVVAGGDGDGGAGGGGRRRCRPSGCGPAGCAGPVSDRS